jgi:hypothetical protein
MAVVYNIMETNGNNVEVLLLIMISAGRTTSYFLSYSTTTSRYSFGWASDDIIFSTKMSRITNGPSSNERLQKLQLEVRHLYSLRSETEPHHRYTYFPVHAHALLCFPRLSLTCAAPLDVPLLPGRNGTKATYESVHFALYMTPRGIA